MSPVDMCGMDRLRKSPMPVSLCPPGGPNRITSMSITSLARAQRSSTSACGTLSRTNDRHRMPGHQMALNLGNRVQGHTHNDEQSCTAKIERYTVRTNQTVGRIQTTERYKEPRVNGLARGPRFSSLATWTKSGDIAALTTKVVSYINGVERDRRIEIREEDDHPDVQEIVGPCTRQECSTHGINNGCA